jgi:type I restriction enzyme S subunit
MTPHDLIAAFETLAEAPDGVKRLRELVLQLAVRGKLVPQDPADEPASVLLERIAVGGGARGARGSATLDRVELPHDVPACWTWCRLGELANPQAGFAFQSSFFNEVGDGVPLIRIRDVLRGTTATYYSGEYRAEFLVEEGDYLIGMDGNFNIGRWNGGRALLNQRVSRLQWYTPEVVPAFIVVALQHRIDSLQGEKAYTTVQHLSGKQISNAEIPLPPLAEQHRIVARVDELMGLLDRLEAARNARERTRAALRDAALAALREADTPEEVEVAWQRVAEQMDDLFTDPADVTPLRQAILQLAVRGKLVPQDPADEPASVLLERIAAEKARLVKEGEIRKTEALPPVSGDEVPFEVPVTWAWTRLDELVDAERPVSYGVLVPGPDVQEGVPLVRVADLHPASPLARPEKTISEAVAAEYQRVVLRGDEVLVCVVGSIGKIGVAHPNWRGAVVARAVARFGVVQQFSRGFVVGMLLASSAQGYFQRATRSMAQPTLNVGLLRRLPVPTPPLAEQHRIVAKVDELMGVLDNFEQRLANQRDLHDAFAAAAVHHLDA